MFRLHRTLLALTAFGAAFVIGQSSAMASKCVAFVHGTGDQTVSSATSGYWEQETIDKYREGYPYVVVGYKGTSYAAFDERSWGDVTRQIDNFGDSRGCSSYVVVTHSNGSNPLRYMLMHPTARTSSTNGSKLVSEVTSKISRVIFLAPDNKGTVLADKVTTNGTLLNLANELVSMLGLMNYNTPAVWQQRRDRMTTYNGNGTFSDSSGACGARSTCGGVTSQHSEGTEVQVAPWKGHAWCEGYHISLGLKATYLYGWGSNGCSDGFLGCASQSYNGSRLHRTSKLNHNQSRRDCDDLEDLVGASVRQAPVIYQEPVYGEVSPASMACNATVQGWVSGYPWMPGSNYFWGCPSSWRNDGYVDHDCVASYETDDGVTVPQQYSQTAYASYYCPDSWRGDGVCDVCLLAKYGHDVLEGTSDGAGDCQVQSTNVCSDLAYNNYYGVYDNFAYYATH